jgi:hypothetical protein
MPAPRTDSEPQPQPTPIADATQAWLDDFISGFRRTRKGSLWREYDDLRLTVYLHRLGGYRWVLSGPDGRRYSKRAWESEEEALSALFYELEGG